jgi:hypothetical protein
MRKRLLTAGFVLLALAALGFPETTTTAITATTTTHVNNSGQLAFAAPRLVVPRPADWCDWIRQACKEKAQKVHDDCVVRDEGFGTGVGSCYCQGIREYSNCMNNNNCGGHPSVEYVEETDSKCFN